MLKKIKNFLFYGGVDKSDFNRVKSKIQKDNLTMVTVLSVFATILIAATLVSSFNSKGIEQNRIVYVLGIIMSLSILLLSTTTAKNHTHMITILVYLCYMIYYMYGILIGTITDPTGKTVTFIVLLVFMPILFIDRPLNVIFVTGINLILFIVLCLMNKTGSVLTVDILDAVTFGILGSASGSVANHMKIKGYVTEKELQETREELEDLSKKDLLTTMRNRNAYLLERHEIPDLCNYSLACIYMDVNGLHELNNTLGHESGDEMLIKIAKEIRHFFGEDFSYRIGGDEFVAFVLDKKSEEIDLLIKQLVEKIEKQNYHVAIGYERSLILHLCLHDLIETAEDKMKQNKEQYYRKNGHRQMRNNR